MLFAVLWFNKLFPNNFT